MEKEKNMKKNILIFEGEYSRDKRNGEGKEYYPNGNILFEGEYYYYHKLKGKEYYPNGNSEFEGEYLYDSKWNGKGYNKNGKLIYELKDGDGKVREYKKGILVFKGEYLKGKKMVRVKTLMSMMN